MRHTLEQMLATKQVARLAQRAVINPSIDEAACTLDFTLQQLSVYHSVPLALLLSQPLKEEYLTLVATAMLTEGYLYVPMNGGQVVVSPAGEEYQLSGDTCTCSASNYRKHEPCKHLLLRDYFVSLRNRVDQYKKHRSLA